MSPELFRYRSGVAHNFMLLIFLLPCLATTVNVAAGNDSLSAIRLITPVKSITSGTPLVQSMASRSFDNKYLYVMRSGLTEQLSQGRYRSTGLLSKYSIPDGTLEKEYEFSSTTYQQVSPYYQNISPLLIRLGREMHVLVFDSDFRIKCINVETGKEFYVDLPVDKRGTPSIIKTDDVALIEQSEYDSQLKKNKYLYYDLFKQKNVSEEMGVEDPDLIFRSFAVYAKVVESTDTTVRYDIYSLKTFAKLRSVIARKGDRHQWSGYDKGSHFLWQADSSGEISMTDVLSGRSLRRRYNMGIHDPKLSVNGKYLVFVNSLAELVSMDCESGKVDVLLRDFRRNVDAVGPDSVDLFVLNSYNDDYLGYYCRDSIQLYNLREKKSVVAIASPTNFISFVDQCMEIFQYDYQGTHFRLTVCDTLGRIVQLDHVIDGERFPFSQESPAATNSTVYRTEKSLFGIMSLNDLGKVIMQVPKVSPSFENVQSISSVLWAVDSTKFVAQQETADSRRIFATYRKDGGDLHGISEFTENDWIQSVGIKKDNNRIVIVKNRNDTARGADVLWGSIDSLHDLRRKSLDIIERSPKAKEWTATVSGNNEIVTVCQGDSLIDVLSGNDYEQVNQFKLEGRVLRVYWSPDKSKALVLSIPDTSTGKYVYSVYDSAFAKRLYSVPWNASEGSPRFSASGRYILFGNDIVDTRTWKSVYMVGGDYNGDLSEAGFVNEEKYFVRSTIDFGLYVLNLTDINDRTYKNYRGRAYCSASGEYVWVVDSVSILHCIRTKDWKEISSIQIPFRAPGDLDNVAKVYPHPKACATAFFNDYGTLYIWYPLTSSVTSVDNTTFRDSSGGSSYAISIPCRNGISQLALQAAPDPGSMRVIDVLGREVAWSIENSIVRLSQCRAGYHLVTYRHAGRTQSIPVMVVEE